MVPSLPETGHVFALENGEGGGGISTFVENIREAIGSTTNSA